jgi:hypothetical protein
MGSGFMSRIFDCVILSHWGELDLLAKRFTAYKDNPDVTHVICECAADLDGNPKPLHFKDSRLAREWHGKWTHIRVEAHEVTGNSREEREASLKEFLLHGFTGGPDDLIMFTGIRDIPETPSGVPRGSITRIADLRGHT